MQQKTSNVSEYVTHWGCSASVALLDPKCQIYTDPNVNGMIGYKTYKNYFVAFGDPVCAPEDTSKLANSFRQFANEHSKDLIYLTASEGFTSWAMKNGFHALLETEEELIMDPATCPKTGNNGRLLNKKMRHAERDGVIIKEYSNHDENVKRRILEAESKWLKGRKGLQIFLSQIDFFEDDIGKRCFYAEQNNQIVGVIFLTRLEAQNGWLLYLLFTIPEAPVGTSEYLLVSVLEKLTYENCYYFSFGISAAEKLGEIIGLDRISIWIARTGFQFIKKLFKLDNRRNFWKKFEPRNKRSFILFSKPRIGLKAIIAIIKSLNASV